MRKDVVLFLMFFVAPGLALAQDWGPDFWDKPGETTRDSSGKVIYQEVKDRANFTMRVYRNGGWLTYHFRPHTATLMNVDAADVSEDYLYDATGTWNGITVRGFGRPLTARGDRNSISTEGLPPIVVDKDGMGRAHAVRYGSTTVLSVEYAPAGTVRRLRIGALTLSFELVDNGIHEVLSANGNVLKETTALAFGKTPHSFPLSLDAVAGRLSLSRDWTTRVRTHQHGTGFAMTVHDGAAVVARLLTYGTNRVGFSKAGDPLFYDVGLYYGAPGGDTNAGLTRAFGTVLPSNIVVTADGNVEVYVDRPATAAIQSVQTSLLNPGSFSFKVFNPSQTSASKASRPLSAEHAVQTMTLNTPRVIWS